MEAGLHKFELTFDYPALAGWRWPAIDIVGQRPGPRLAIITGVHVNETSSIEAVIRLQRTIDPGKLTGRISIIPITNLPAVPVRSQYVCPIDNKNINFSFPGRPNGSFSEALAYALLNDWASDADCFVDLHGGDLCEQVAHFMVVQRTGDQSFDQRSLGIARCFDAEIIASIDPSHMDEPGRSVSGRAKRRQYAAFAEAGRWGLIEEMNVAFHLNGLLRLLHHLGMTDSAPQKNREAVIITRYHWIPAPVDGFFRYHVEPGQKVAMGQHLATAENTYGEEIAPVAAPEEGHILWRITHALSPKDSFIIGLGAQT